MPTITPTLYSIVSYYLLGLLSAFSPCTYPLLPVLAIYIVGSGSRGGRSILASLLFSTGLTAAVVGLALAALYAKETVRALVGTLDSEALASASLLALFVIGFAMLTPFKELMASISVPLPRMKRGGLLMAPLLGAIFFIASAPCSGAYVIALALGAMSWGESAAASLLILSLAFGAGMSTPFAALGMAASEAASLYSKLGRSLLVRRSGEIAGLALMLYAYVSLLLVGGRIDRYMPYSALVGDALWTIALTYLALVLLRAASSIRGAYASGDLDRGPTEAPSVLCMASASAGLLLLALGTVLGMWDPRLQVSGLLKYAGAFALLAGALPASLKTLKYALPFVLLKPQSLLATTVFPELTAAIAWALLFAATRSRAIGWTAAGFVARALAYSDLLSRAAVYYELELLVSLIAQSLSLTAPLMLVKLAVTSHRGAKGLARLIES